MVSTEYVLRTFDLTKGYARKAAVDHVTLTIKQGEVYGLIGKNGAGKTTFIRMVTSLVHPDGGEMELFGEREAEELSKARSRMGSIVETPALYPNLTAAQNLEYYRIQQGIPDRECVSQALEMAGLSGTGSKKFGQFSLGMKQRLGLALSVLNDPDFLILDEPVNGLDPMGIVDIRKTLHHLNEDLGITILISSHILSELYLLATNYGIINDGKLVKEFTKDQLDEESKRCLRVIVDDVKTAAIVLETVLGTTRYQVTGQNEIRIYDYLDTPAEVTYRLSAANVRVSSISEMGTNLEDYFRAAIGEGE